MHATDDFARRSGSNVARAASKGEGSGRREVPTTPAPINTAQRQAQICDEMLKGFTILPTVDADGALWDDDGA